MRGFKNGPATDWLRASVLALRLPHQDHGSDEAYPQLQKLLAELPAASNAQLFWTQDALIQSIRPVTDPWERLWQVIGHNVCQINLTRDLSWIRDSIIDSTKSLADRAMLLEAAMRLAPNQAEWRDHVNSLKPAVADRPELLAVIEERLKPRKPDKEHKRWEKEDARRTKQLDRKEASDRASWVKFWQEVADLPDTVFSPTRSFDTILNLWRAMRKVGGESRDSGWNRRFIETQFGKETADRLRLTLMEQWRQDRPTLTSERPDDAKGTYLVRWQLGLAAIYAEAEDPQWANRLSSEEAELAARFATIELNSLPLWMEALVRVHPVAVVATLGEELRLELESEVGGDHWHSMLLQNIGHAPKPVIGLFLPIIRAWLDAKCKCKGQNARGTAQRIGQVVDFLLKHGDEEIYAHISSIARERLGKRISASFAQIWLPALMRLDACSGVDALESRIKSIRPAKQSKAVLWFAHIFGDRHNSINLADPKFTPQTLLRLLSLAYRHVRPADDAKHEGCYSPDDRDDAESARNWIVNALLKADGEEGWAAKLEMAADPLCAHFRDRIIALAEEHWAEEIDGVALDEVQAIALDKTGEAPACSNETMFAIMVDRLDDLNDLLLRDVSPREAWEAITEERVMRREIARALNYHANELYKTGQEGVTADEKETDIRLISTTSPHEAVIELKLADGRSAKDLRDTLETQLVTKYMAPETRRSGCLMITLSRDRQWDHPDSGNSIGFKELVALLQEEAARIVQKLGGTLRLHVCALDLRPRLPIESKRAKKTSRGKDTLPSN